MFTLVVDDFGVKHLVKSSTVDLVQALKDECEVEVKWEGNKLFGINLKYNYNKCECQLNVPGHVKKTPAKI